MTTESIDVLATVSFMSPIDHTGHRGHGHSRSHGAAPLALLDCPYVPEPGSGLPRPDPACTVPPTLLAAGQGAVDFQVENRLLTGDLLQVTLNVSTVAAPADPAAASHDPNPESGAARRLLRPKHRANRTRDSHAGRAGAPRTLAASAYLPGSARLVSAGGQKEIYTGAPIVLRTVVYLVDVCGWLSPFRSPQEFYQYAFSGPGAVENNLQNYYSTCSYNKTQLLPEHTAVLGPITLPCAGTLNRTVFSVPYNSSRACGAAEQSSWVSAAEAYGREAAATDPALAAILSWPTRRRALMVLPGEVPCGWAGLADVACTGMLCRVFVKGAYGRVMADVFHELQHTVGLSHTARGSDEYGDPTDPMGDSAGVADRVQCHNPASLYRMGWATPLNGPGPAPLYGNGAYGNLTATNFTPASNRLTFTLPASGTIDAHMVVVNLAVASNSPGAPLIPYPKLFLSYRVRNASYGGYDTGLPAAYSQKVVLYGFNGTQDERDFNRSTLLDAGPRFQRPDPAFPAGNVWTAPFVPYDGSTGLGGGLRVTVRRTGAESAEVELCRMYALREGEPGGEGCYDGADKDCDGLVGEDDPDCAAATPAPTVKPTVNPTPAPTLQPTDKPTPKPTPTPRPTVKPKPKPKPKPTPRPSASPAATRKSQRRTAAAAGNA